MIKSTKAFLLAGASAMAILASAAEANAETFTIPGTASFTASVSGEYAVEVLGASGGNSTGQGTMGALGAEVSGDVFLTAGEDLTLFVGGLERGSPAAAGAAAVSSSMGRMSLPAPAGAAALPSLEAVPDKPERAARQEPGLPLGPAAWVGTAAAPAPSSSAAAAAARA